jgi:hypothetical protein
MKITPCLFSYLRTSAICNNSSINKVRETLIAIFGLFIVLMDSVFKVMEDLLNRVEEWAVWRKVFNHNSLHSVYIEYSLTSMNTIVVYDDNIVISWPLVILRQDSKL